MDDMNFTINFDANVNMGNLDALRDNIFAIQEQYNALKRSFGQNPPDFAAPYIQQCDSIQKTIANIGESAQKLQGQIETGKVAEGTKSQVFDQLVSQYQHLATTAALFGSSGSFSLQAAHSLMAGFPQAVSKQLSRITPQIASILRSGLSNITGSSSIISRSTKGIVNELVGMNDIQKLFNSPELRKAGVTGKQFTDYIEAHLPMMMPVYRTDAYNQKRYGTNYSNARLQYPMTVAEVLPQRFAKAFESGKFTPQKIDGRSAIGKQILGQASLHQLTTLFQNNGVAAKVALASGIARHGRNGDFRLSNQISRNDLERYQTALYQQLMLRGGGFGQNKFDPYDPLNREQFIRRMMSGSSGKSATAAYEIQNIISGNDWVKRQPKVKPHYTPIKPAAMPLERYGVQRRDLFSSAQDQNKTIVQMDESFFTDIVGLRGRNYQNTDKFLRLNIGRMTEQQRQDPATRQKLGAMWARDSKGQRVGYIHPETGKRYIPITIHGTGEDTTVVMTQFNAMRKARAQQQQIARKIHNDPTGIYDVWNNDVQGWYGDNGEAFGRHVDALGKGLSGSSRIESDLRNLRVAVVDDKKRLDGTGFASNRVLYGDIQSREGIFGKGTLSRFGYQTYGDYAAAQGLIKRGQSYYMTGPTGQPVDVSKANIVIDKSQLKQLGVIMHEGDTNEMINDRVTQYLQRPGGFRAMRNFANDKLVAQTLGSQATTFLRPTPETMREITIQQMRQLDSLFEKLDNPQQVKNIVFADRLNDAVSRKVWEDPSFINNEVAQRRIELYRQSKMSQIASGQWFNVKDKAGRNSFTQQRLLISPMIAQAMKDGKVNPAVLADVKDSIVQQYGQQFLDKYVTDDLLKNVLMLKTITDKENPDENDSGKKLLQASTMLDFGTMPSEKDFLNGTLFSTISAIRSPTGYGNMVYGRNYARLLMPYFKRHNLPMTGLQLNASDMEALSGADRDADEAKILTGVYADAVRETLEDIMYNDPYANEKIEVHQKQIQKKNAGQDLPQNWADAALRSIDATRYMGFYSNAMSGAMQHDFARNVISRYIARRGNAGYDPATTLLKKPVQLLTAQEKQLRAALSEGRQFQKFPNHMSSVFDVKAYPEENLYKTGSGQVLDPKDVYVYNRPGAAEPMYLNKKVIQRMNIDKYNLPSLNIPAMVESMQIARDLNLKGFGDKTIADALTAVLTDEENGIGFEGMGPAVKAARKAFRGIFAQTVGLQKFSLSDQQAITLQQLLDAANQQILADANSKPKSAHGDRIKLDDGTYVSKSKYISDLRSAGGLQHIQLALSDFGFRSLNMRRIFGEKDGNDLALYLSSPDIQQPWFAAPNIPSPAQILQQKSQQRKPIIKPRNYKFGSAMRFAKNNSTPAEPDWKKNIPSQYLKDTPQETLSEMNAMLARKQQALAQYTQANNDMMVEVNKPIIEQLTQKRDQLDAYIKAQDSIKKSNKTTQATQKVKAKKDDWKNGIPDKYIRQTPQETLNALSDAVSRIVIPQDSSLSGTAFTAEQQNIINAEQYIREYINTNKTQPQGRISGKRKRTNRTNVSNSITPEQQMQAAVNATVMSDLQKQMFAYQKNMYSIGTTEETTDGKAFYLSQASQLARFRSMVEDMQNKAEMPGSGMSKQAAQDMRSLYNKIQGASMIGSRNYLDTHVSDIVKRMENKVAGKKDDIDKYVAAMQSYDKDYLDAQETLQYFQKQRAQRGFDKDDKQQQELDRKAKHDAEQRLVRAFELRDQGKAQIRMANEQIIAQSRDQINARLYGKDTSAYAKIQDQVLAATLDVQAHMGDIKNRYDSGLISKELYEQQTVEAGKQLRYIQSGQYQSRLTQAAIDNRQKQMRSLRNAVTGTSDTYERRTQQIQALYDAAQRIVDDNTDLKSRPGMSQQQIAKSEQQAIEAIELAMRGEENIKNKTIKQFSRDADMIDKRISKKSMTKAQLIQMQVDQQRQNINQKLTDLNAAKADGLYDGRDQQYQRIKKSYEDSLANVDGKYRDALIKDEKTKDIKALDSIYRSLNNDPTQAIRFGAQETKSRIDELIKGLKQLGATEQQISKYSGLKDLVDRNAARQEWKQTLGNKVQAHNIMQQYGLLTPQSSYAIARAQRLQQQNELFDNIAAGTKGNQNLQGIDPTIAAYLKNFGSYNKKTGEWHFDPSKATQSPYARYLQQRQIDRMDADLQASITGQPLSAEQKYLRIRDNNFNQLLSKWNLVKAANPKGSARYNSIATELFGTTDDQLIANYLLAAQSGTRDAGGAGGLLGQLFDRQFIEGNGLAQSLGYNFTARREQINQNILTAIRVRARYGNATNLTRQQMQDLEAANRLLGDDNGRSYRERQYSSYLGADNYISRYGSSDLKNELRIAETIEAAKATKNKLEASQRTGYALTQRQQSALRDAEYKMSDAWRQQQQRMYQQQMAMQTMGTVGRYNNFLVSSLGLQNTLPGKIFSTRNSMLTNLSYSASGLGSSLQQMRNNAITHGWMNNEGAWVDTSTANAQAAKAQYDQIAAAQQSSQKMMAALSGPNGYKYAAGFMAISSMVSMITNTIKKIINDVNKFAQEYNKATTELQMITMTDKAGADKIGKSIVNKAKNLRMTFSQVAAVQTALYRQGLSSEQVDSRTDTIAKLSKVSGLKATDTTKLITVAMNSGLATSAEDVANAVAAIGDSAATTAAEIAKGFSKAAAAAGQVGVNYQELIAMLATITSTTQVTGTVAGTTLGSIFGRWQKASLENLTYDEYGNMVNGNDIYTALKYAGIDMYDATGKRSITDVFVDIGQKWEDLADWQKDLITSSMAGTRQISNFSALVAGFSEKDANGQTTIDRMINGANSSTGVLDAKYEAYMQSMEAAQTNLQNSGQRLMVATGVDKLPVAWTNFLSDTADNISDVFTGDSFGKKAGTVGTGLAGLGLGAWGGATAGAAMGSIIPFIGTAIGGILGGLAGGLFGGIGGTGVGADVAALFKPEDTDQIGRNVIQSSLQQYKSIQNSIGRAQALGQKVTEGTITKQQRIQLANIYDSFNTLYGASINVSTVFEELKTNAAAAAEQLGKVQESARENVINTITNAVTQMNKNVGSKADQARQKAQQQQREYERYSGSMQGINFGIRKNKNEQLSTLYGQDIYTYNGKNYIFDLRKNGYLQFTEPQSIGDYTRLNNGRYGYDTSALKKSFVNNGITYTLNEKGNGYTYQAPAKTYDVNFFDSGYSFDYVENGNAFYSKTEKPLFGNETIKTIIRPLSEVTKAWNLSIGEALQQFGEDQIYQATTEYIDASKILGQNFGQFTSGQPIKPIDINSISEQTLADYVKYVIENENNDLARQVAGKNTDGANVLFSDIAKGNIPTFKQYNGLESVLTNKEYVDNYLEYINSLKETRRDAYWYLQSQKNNINSIGLGYGIFTEKQQDDFRNSILSHMSKQLNKDNGIETIQDYNREYNFADPAYLATLLFSDEKDYDIFSKDDALAYFRTHDITRQNMVKYLQSKNDPKYNKMIEDIKSGQYSNWFLDNVLQSSGTQNLNTKVGQLTAGISMSTSGGDLASKELLTFAGRLINSSDMDGIKDALDNYNDISLYARQNPQVARALLGGLIKKDQYGNDIMLRETIPGDKNTREQVYQITDGEGKKAYKIGDTVYKATDEQNIYVAQNGEDTLNANKLFNDINYDNASDQSSYYTKLIRQRAAKMITGAPTYVSKQDTIERAQKALDKLKAGRTDLEAEEWTAATSVYGDRLMWQMMTQGAEFSGTDEANLRQSAYLAGLSSPISAQKANSIASIAAGFMEQNASIDIDSYMSDQGYTEDMVQAAISVNSAFGEYYSMLKLMSAGALEAAGYTKQQVDQAAKQLAKANKVSDMTRYTSGDYKAQIDNIITNVNSNKVQALKQGQDLYNEYSALALAEQAITGDVTAQNNKYLNALGIDTTFDLKNGSYGDGTRKAVEMQRQKFNDKMNQLLKAASLNTPKKRIDGEGTIDDNTVSSIELSSNMNSTQIARVFRLAGQESMADAIMSQGFEIKNGNWVSGKGVLNEAQIAYMNKMMQQQNSSTYTTIGNAFKNGSFDANSFFATNPYAYNLLAEGQLGSYFDLYNVLSGNQKSIVGNQLASFANTLSAGGTISTSDKGMLLAKLLGYDNISTLMSNAGTIDWSQLTKFDQGQSLIRDVLGQDMLTRISNGTIGNIDYDTWYSNYIQQLMNESLYGTKNVTQVANLVSSLTTGKVADSFAAINNMMSSYDELGRANYIYGLGADATYAQQSELAQFLGIDKKDYEQMMKNPQGKEQIKKLLEEKTSDISELLTGVLGQLFEITGIDSSAENAVESLREKGYSWFVDMLEQMGAVFDGTSVSITNPNDANTRSVGDIFGEAWDNYTENNNATKYIGMMQSALDAGDYRRTQRITGDGTVAYTTYTQTGAQAFMSHLQDQYGTNEGWQKFISDNPGIMLEYQKWANGGDQQDFIDYLEQTKYGINRNHDYYANEAANLGINFDDTDNLLETISGIYNMEQGDQKTINIAALQQLISYIPQLQEAFDALYGSQEDAGKAQQKLNEIWANKGYSAAVKHKKNAEEITAAYQAMQKGGMQATKAVGNLQSRWNKLNNLAWARNQFASGDRSDKVIDTIVSQTGLDKAELQGAKAGSAMANSLLKSMDSTIQDEQGQLVNVAQGMLDQITEQINAQNPDFDWGTLTINGEFDASGLLAAAGEEAAAIAAIIQALDGMGIKVEDDGNGGFKLVAYGNNGGFGNAFKGGGSSGGGGKSKAQKLLEQQKNELTPYDHRIKMAQYEQTRFKNAGQLGNYGKMLEAEIALEREYLPILQKHINELKAQMAATKQGSDDWYSLRDAIMKAEEQMSNMNNTIEDNIRELEENQQAILKLKTDIQEVIEAELRQREQERKDRVAGRAEMEQTILEIIKKRYQQEWELLKEDIEKKKQALQEQMDLIDKRLQKRKDAANEAEKYEQLANLKQQLAQIEMDPTRTKDAVEMRKQISDLEKQIAWDVADSEAEAEKQSLQDQMNAYDEYENEYEERLNRFLEDNRNFADEVNEVLKMSSKDMMEWLKTNDQDYIKALDGTQKQMVESWRATYNKMYGIVQNYWNQVASIMSSKDGFIQFMKQSSSYLNASPEQKEQMVYNWSKMWDMWFAAQDTSATFDHNDDFSNGKGPSSTNDNGGPGGNGLDKVGNSIVTGIINGVNSVNSAISSISSSLSNFAGSITAATSVASSLNLKGVGGMMPRYADGGYVTHTGLAYVDGSFSKPESFLDAEDTALLRSMLDAAKFISVPSFMSNIASDRYSTSNNSNSVGEVTINLYEAKLESDADYEQVARRVGENFTKELSKMGMATASYTF